MTHDPFQTYNPLGQYYGIPTPIGLQYPSLQNPVNPIAALNPALNPLLGQSPITQMGGIPQMGQQPYGQNVNPQQLQLLTLLASLLSNPLVAASLQHSQAFNPYGQQFGQQQSFYPPIGPQIGAGYPLAPQSWIGQGQFGGGQGFGQPHPFLSQLSQRPFQAQGFSPWGY